MSMSNNQIIKCLISVGQDSVLRLLNLIYIVTYVASCYMLTSPTQFGLFFKIGYVKGMMGEQELTQLAFKILSDDSTGCDEVGGYFATEADTMIDTVYEDDLGEFLNI